MGTLVMGILNVTPDSFSDGGRYHDVDAAIAHGIAMAAAGAELIDVGGESTKPGALSVDPVDERRRVLPVIRALAGEGIPVSIDTIHASTAEAAVLAGATTINDVSGGEHDPLMRGVAAATGARYIAMHWRGVPSVGTERSRYRDVVSDVRDELARIADLAERAGVDASRIVIDPGLGFDKTAAQGWSLLAAVPELRACGYPVLIGISRKRMLVETLGSPLTQSDRDHATSVVSALAAAAGVWGVRVHDVESTVRALRIWRAWNGGLE